MNTRQCHAATKKGGQCQIDARPSGLCHTHDPEVRCRVRNAKGKPCVIPSGGGPCDRHQGGEQTSVAEALKDVPLFKPAGVASLFAIKDSTQSSPAAAMLSEATHEPQGPDLSFEFVARTFNWN
ncbi:hypothetical protein [Streptomyces sp. LN699]|uniref:hypothetical protein n=1 Tax=Streptomyces sp. LN699 TaxID=3112981 RepID=UPI003714CE7C